MNGMKLEKYRHRAMYGFGQAGFIAGKDVYYLAGFGALLAVGCAASLPVGRNLFKKLPEKLRQKLEAEKAAAQDGVFNAPCEA